jgi:hypothetical protein
MGIARIGPAEVTPASNADTKHHISLHPELLTTDPDGLVGDLKHHAVDRSGQHRDAGGVFAIIPSQGVALAQNQGFADIELRTGPELPPGRHRTGYSEGVPYLATGA